MDGLLARLALVRDVELLGVDLLVTHPDLGAVVALSVLSAGMDEDGRRQA